MLYLHAFVFLVSTKGICYAQNKNKTEGSNPRIYYAKLIQKYIYIFFSNNKQNLIESLFEKYIKFF